MRISGRERDIGNMLLDRILACRPDFDASTLLFGHVGRNSRARKKAIRVARGDERADVVLTTRRLPKLLWKEKDRGTYSR